MPVGGRRQEAGGRRAVVLLSGGLDSYTAAAIARAEGFVLFALTVRYGQLHACELEAARRVGRALEVAPRRAPANGDTEDPDDDDGAVWSEQ